MANKNIVTLLNTGKATFVVSQNRYFTAGNTMNFKEEEAKKLVSQYPLHFKEVARVSEDAPVKKVKAPKLGDKKDIVRDGNKASKKKSTTKTSKDNKEEKKFSQELEKLIGDAKELGIENPGKLSEGELINAIEDKLNSDEK